MKERHIILGSIVLIVILLVVAIAKPKPQNAELKISDVYTPTPKLEPAPEIKTEEKPNPYLKKYAGKYEFVYDEISPYDNSKEYFTLHSDGSCVWKYVSDGMASEKYGTWSAEKGVIRTTIIGRSGDEIKDDYVYKNSFFRSFNHYLRKIKDL